MGALPHSFKGIRLNRARSKEFPQGSRRHGYELVVPPTRPVTSMRGAEHRRWVFDYDATAEDDDESGYRFGAHAFRPGEYVSIRSEEGEMSNPFRDS